MRQYLLDLLHNNPLPTGAIVAHLQRFPMDDCDHRKVPEVLRELERDGQLKQVCGEQDLLGAKMGHDALMEWHRIYTADELKPAIRQKTMF